MGGLPPPFLPSFLPVGGVSAHLYCGGVRYCPLLRSGRLICTVAGSGTVPCCVVEEEEEEEEEEWSREEVQCGKIIRHKNGE